VTAYEVPAGKEVNGRGPTTTTATRVGYPDPEEPLVFEAEAAASEDGVLLVLAGLRAQSPQPLPLPKRGSSLRHRSA
jgi:hypothetical protein